MINRNRFIYGIIIILVIIMGLLSRKVWSFQYMGDVLWALMVYCMFGFVFNNRHPLTIALLTILFSFSIEISQLYQGEFINNIRNTFIGGLILGYGFLWSDLICYSIGTIIGIALDKVVIVKLGEK